MFGKMEQLESRQMMAGDLMVADYRVYDVGLIALYYPITVNGTGGTDIISISSDGAGTLSVINNGVVNSYAEWQITKVIVNGFGGNDTINASWSNTPVEAHGGYGADTVYGGAAADVLTGGGDSDRLYGNAGNDNLDGGVGGFASYWENTGNDYLLGGDGNDTLNASDVGNNSLYGGNGDDNMYGWSGNDYLSGGYGSDAMYGYTGDDTLYGSYGTDYIYGQDGNDTLRGDADGDFVYGGWGNDQVRGDSGNDWCFGDGGDDNVRGDAGADNVYGDDGNDNLYGGADNDYLNGGWGDDGLFGGTGIDTLVGGSGDDRFLDRTWEENVWWWTERRWEDSITDYASNDARLGFQNAPQQTVNFAGQNGSYTFAAGSWTDAEIELLDTAFEQLHDATANTRLLKRSNGDNQVFFRAGAQIASSGGTFSAGAWNSGGSVTFVQVNRATLIHEMGHNWDEEFDAGGWRAQSGWTYQPLWGIFGVPAGYTRGSDSSGNWYYLNSATFVSGYARTNPNEDFAEHFEAFFTNRAGWTSISIGAGKQSFMQNLVNSLM